MLLKEFVDATVSEILESVRELQKTHKSADVGIVAPTIYGGSKQSDPVGYTLHGRRVFTLDFELRVQATQSSGSTGGLGLQIAIVQCRNRRENQRVL